MKLASIYDSAAPYIACFVVLKRGSKVAMVLRKNTGYMDGYFGLPAGKVEWQETYLHGATREAKEEAGVDVDVADLRFLHVCHRHSANGEEFMDWVDVYFEADKWQGEPFNAEPDKSEKLEWLDLNNLPENVVPPQRHSLEQIADNIAYSQFGWND